MANAFSSLRLPKSSSSPFSCSYEQKNKNEKKKSFPVDGREKKKKQLLFIGTMYHYFCHARESCNENLSVLSLLQLRNEKVFKGIYDEKLQQREEF
jgi:hypothetical protein